MALGFENPQAIYTFRFICPCRLIPQIPEIFRHECHTLFHAFIPVLAQFTPGCYPLFRNLRIFWYIALGSYRCEFLPVDVTDGMVRLDDVREKLSSLLAIPESKTIRTIIPFGKPAKEVKQKEKKSMAERAKII